MIKGTVYSLPTCTICCPLVSLTTSSVRAEQTAKTYCQRQRCMSAFYSSIKEKLSIVFTTNGKRQDACLRIVVVRLLIIYLRKSLSRLYETWTHSSLRCKRRARNDKRSSCNRQREKWCQVYLCLFLFQVSWAWSSKSELYHVSWWLLTRLVN